jgi:hypothetical protein
MVETGNSSLNDIMAYYGNKTRPGAHFPCNVDLLSKIRNDSKAGSYKSVIENWILNVPAGHWSNWAVSVFLSEITVCVHCRTIDWTIWKHSRTLLIRKLVICIAKCPDRLGLSGEFVENSTKLTCLEIAGYRIKYSTVLWLLELQIVRGRNV